MSSAICTLFEGSYHHGVAALVNSLHRAGFAGPVYAGHRGALPAWAAGAVPDGLPGWDGACRLTVADGLELVFLPVRTDAHLTNHKPEFMSALLDGPARNASALFYIDPDICVSGPWRYFEEWVSCGLALCEDLNSPLVEHHPRRVGWRRHYAEHGLQLRFRAPEYVNAGFVGLRVADRAFLDTWIATTRLMAETIGSLASAKIGGGAAFRSTGFADCFDCSDQDALNAALELTELPLSVLGKQAMGFVPGAALLPHAVGGGKPWQRGYLRHAIGGVAPRQADKAYWSSADGPLVSWAALYRRLKRVDLVAAAAVGRVLRRA